MSDLKHMIPERLCVIQRVQCLACYCSTTKYNHDFSCAEILGSKHCLSAFFGRFFAVNLSWT